MKLLVIEDDRKIASVVRRGLEREGFTVELAHDGPDGLWRASEGRYDLIVLDIMLPGRNGYRDLRRPPAGRRLDADPDAHRQGRRPRRGRGPRHRRRRLPHQAVLLPRARRAVRALLRAAGGGLDRPRSTAGDLRIDPAARRVLRGDDEVPLTARQFDVLEYLVRRAGDVVSKRRSSTGSGTTTSRATPTSSRSTSAGCGPSSTNRSAATRSPPCAGAGYRLDTDGG